MVPLITYIDNKIVENPDKKNNIDEPDDTSLARVQNQAHYAHILGIRIFRFSERHI